MGELVMKKKININRPDISSEEISERKNFDSILKQHVPASKPFFKKPWFIGGVGIAAVAIVATVITLNQQKSENKTEQASVATTADSAALATFYATEEAKPCINPPLKNLNVPVTIYKVIAEKGTRFEFTTGSKITIPKNSFIDNSGNTIKGEVEVHYREFHNPVDFFIAGIPMTYDSAGVRYHFESAGMLEIKAYQNGEVLAISPEKSIDIELASNYNGNKYNLYKLDTAVNNWACLGKEKIVEPQASTINTTVNKSTTEQQFQQTTEYKTFEAKQVELEKEKDVKMASLALLQAEPQKPQQAKKDKYTFDIEVNPKEFPELITYKGVLFEVGSENKNFTKAMFNITWDDATIKEGPDKGKNYLLTVKQNTKSYPLIVYPVYEGKNYETALKAYQDKFAGYTVSLEKRKADEKEINDEYNERIAQIQKQQEEAKRKWQQQQDEQFKRMDTKEKVMRVFAINSFGVYNSDCPSKYPQGLSCTAQLNKEQNTKLMCYDVFLVDNKQNALFTYTKNPVVKFSFDPSAKNILWTVENDVLYYLKPEQFQQIKGGANINEIQLNKVEQKFKTADELKAFFNL